MVTQTQYGRSMIEMLGVLTVTGILSIGALKTFSHVLAQYKTNQDIEDYTFFINGILQNRDVIFKANEYHIGQQLVYLDIIPRRWKNEGNTFYDGEGREIFPYVPISRINIEYRLKTSRQQKSSLLFCQKLWANVLIPYADALYQVYIITDEKVNYYWGDNFCNSRKPCFSSLSIPQIIDECSLCLDSSQCKFNFTFK